MKSKTERKIDNPARYRMEGRMIVMILLFVPIAILGIWGSNHLHAIGDYAYLLAALFSLMPIGLIVLFGLYLAEETDEFERATQVQSLLWGIGGTLIVDTFWGSLEVFGKAPHVAPMLTNPMINLAVFGFFIGAARWVIRWRYR